MKLADILTLTEVGFLSFIEKIPKAVFGVVTGLLPSVLLVVLMELVPIVCRCKPKPPPMHDMLTDTTRDGET